MYMCIYIYIYQFSSVAQSCATHCDPMDCSTSGLPVHHQFLELTQTHVHWLDDAFQPFHPLLSPSPPAFNLCQHQSPFKWVGSSASGGQSIRVLASTSVLSMNFQDWFPLGWIAWISLQSKGLSRDFSTPQFKSINSLALSFLYSPTLASIMTTGKTIALTKWTFVNKVMSLLFNMLSRLVIAFLPRNKRLLISWLQSPSAVTLEPKKIKSATFPVSPSICHEVMGPDAMICFRMLSFKPTFHSPL